MAWMTFQPCFLAVAMNASPRLAPDMDEAEEPTTGVRIHLPRPKSRALAAALGLGSSAAADHCRLLAVSPVISAEVT